MNEVTHIFDLLNWLIGNYPLSICALGGKADDNVLVLEYFRTCVLNNTMPETNHIKGAVATLTAIKALESLKARRIIDLDFSAFTKTNAEQKKTCSAC